MTIRFIHSLCVVCGQTFAHRSTYKAKHCSNKCSKVTVTATKQAQRRKLEAEYSLVVAPIIGCRWLAVASGNKRFVYSHVDVSVFDEVSQLLWGLSTRGYVFRRRGKVNVYLHHIAFGGRPPSGDVDHINRDQLDNRRVNLRLATHSQNCTNIDTFNSNTSGYHGVNWARDAWVARISIDGKRIFLGRFETKEDAARAYDDASLRLRGEFAKLNFPKTETN